MFVFVGSKPDGTPNIHELLCLDNGGLIFFYSEEKAIEWMNLSENKNKKKSGYYKIVEFIPRIHSSIGRAIDS